MTDLYEEQIIGKPKTVIIISGAGGLSTVGTHYFDLCSFLLKSKVKTIFAISVDKKLTNPRGSGLFCAFDLPNSDQRDNLIKLIAEEGALMLGSGHRSIRFRPHLNINQNEIDTGISMIRKALGRL